jgi:hypothetical protein
MSLVTIRTGRAGCGGSVRQSVQRVAARNLATSQAHHSRRMRTTRMMRMTMMMTIESDTEDGCWRRIIRHKNSVGEASCSLSVPTFLEMIPDVYQLRWCLAHSFIHSFSSPNLILCSINQRCSAALNYDNNHIRVVLLSLYCLLPLWLQKENEIYHWLAGCQLLEFSSDCLDGLCWKTRSRRIITSYSRSRQHIYPTRTTNRNETSAP